jgi:hypothetical protein
MICDDQIALLAISMAALPAAMNAFAVPAAPPS